MVAGGLLAALYAWVLVVRWKLPGPLPDFSVFWSAGHLAAQGKAAVAYDWESISRVQPVVTPIARFFYPPVFLIVLAPLGTLAFGPATAVWLGGTLAAFLAGMRAILPGATAMIAALAMPMVFFNFDLGQNGLLTAGLLAGALAVLDTRPIMSGVLIGLLSYKPQFGLVLPLVLAVTSRWRVFGSAALTVLCLLGVALALFGADTFAAFLRGMPTANAGYMHDRFMVVKWDHFASVYGMLRSFGVEPPAAWAGHAAIALATIAATLRIATGGASAELKAATVATATMLVTPYSELNDAAVLMVAWAFLVRDGLSTGLHAWEKVVLSIVFLLPLSYVAGPMLAEVLWSPQSIWRSSVVAPLSCAMLAAVILYRIRSAATAQVRSPQAAIGSGRSA
jgi:glycosyl transferase family 87